MENKSESLDAPISPPIRSNVALIGATGYGGLQVVRLLKDHPDFSISFLGANKSVGKKWNNLFPFLQIPGDPILQAADPDKISDVSDIAILSLPNGLASQLVPELLKRNIRVIDLSADYRYRSLELWKSIYIRESKKYTRNDSDLCLEATYGLPEWNSFAISNSRIVSCPGCFPTSSLLPLLPFLKQGLVERQGLIIDAKSGTSGGGRDPKEHLLFSEITESISPYGVIGHRHTSEIEQQASEVAGQSLYIQFTPHLVPMSRGILSTVYARLRDPGLTAEDCSIVLSAHYRDQENIEVLPVGCYPSTKWVRHTNKALLSVEVDIRNGQLILMCVIDNLIKGQSGQAIQSLNIMSGLDKDKALPITCHYP